MLDLEPVRIADGEDPVPVQLNPVSGKFCASYRGEDLKADSLEAMIAALKKARNRKKANVSVKYLAVDLDNRTGYSYRGDPVGKTREARVQEREGYGLHATHGRVLFKDSEGRKSEEGYSSGVYLKPLSDEGRAELFRLWEARDKAKDELDAFVKLHAIDPRQELREQIAKANG